MANGTKLTQPFHRDELLHRLSRHAVRPVRVPKDDGGSYISHLETPRDNHVGLKLWAYIGALELKLVRV